MLPKAPLLTARRAWQRVGARARDTATAGWDWIERSRVRAGAAATLLVAAILGFGAVAANFLDDVSEGDPSVIDEIRSSESWITDPTVYAEAERIFDERTVPIERRARGHLEVRTAQELADKAPALIDQPVIVVGRVAAVETREPAHPDLGRTEIALLGDDRRSRVTLVGGVSIGNAPPPAIPRTPTGIVPAPGALQRFEPDYRYGIFVGMVAAVGTTTSPDGGPVRTVYLLASGASLGTDLRLAPRLGPAVRQALSDL